MDEEKVIEVFKKWNQHLADNPEDFEELDPTNEEHSLRQAEHFIELYNSI